ncbi:MAG: hypothetical protein ACK5O2_04475 [Microthrixaceae bacterium]
MEGSNSHDGRTSAPQSPGLVADQEPSPGTAVLDWLCTEAAAGAARRRLARSGFEPQPALVDDVLSDARVAVITRMRSAEPLAPDSPAAYGTAVINNLVKRLTRGETVFTDELDGEPAASEAPQEDRTGDEIRLLLEATPTEPWVTSAALAYLCLLMDPDSVPESAPSPQAGARADQALAWPALWFAGDRDIFPDLDPDGEGDPRKRTRARRIRRVLDHIESAFARYRESGGR